MNKYRKGVFFVVYAKNKKGNMEYLILKRQLHWIGWEFPKGGIEKSETHLNTIKRELKEETGLTPLNFRKFDVKGKFKYQDTLEDRPEKIGQTFESLYAVEVNKQNIKVDKIEHNDFRWVDFNSAKKLLTWENQKTSIETVHKWLELRKFREHITKSGLFIFSGKNKKQNEALVDRFKGAKNIIMHTAASGSPFCVIDDLKPSKQDIKEASIFCAKYSQDWRDNQKDVTVHIFDGKSVYKGKNMPLGTFGVQKAKKIIIKKNEIK